MVKDIKRKSLRVFFVLEILIFFGVYLFGAQGVSYIWQLQRENDELEHAIATLQTEVDALNNELVAWNTHPFYQEKVAREKLQMARAGEYVYYLS